MKKVGRGKSLHTYLIIKYDPHCQLCGEFNNLCIPVPLQFYPVDQECIWGLLTLEQLLLMCQTAPMPSGPGLTELRPPQLEASQDLQPRISQVPFKFDLIRLLPKCQQVELLVSTYVQG